MLSVQHNAEGVKIGKLTRNLRHFKGKAGRSIDVYMDAIYF